MAPKRERRCPATLIIREMQMKAKLGSTVTCQSGKAEQASEGFGNAVCKRGKGQGLGHSVENRQAVSPLKAI